MNTFSFMPIKDAKPCEALGFYLEGVKNNPVLCGIQTRIRIDGSPCCSDHMALRLKAGAMYRLVEVARRERDRRREQRRASMDCLLCAASFPHEHKRTREQRQEGGRRVNYDK
jgi:hypothetical protein